MRYYVTSDIHGYYSYFVSALESAGYYSFSGPKKIIILGDLFDRGDEACKLQDFILELMQKKQVLLVKGNHEDLFVDFIEEDGGLPYQHHVHNGTFDTALQLTGFDLVYAATCSTSLTKALSNTPYYRTIIPAMKNYVEIDKYIFVHGWIPCFENLNGSYSFNPDWRNSNITEWQSARWINGIEASRFVQEKNKTIICGHWHTSYGHFRFEEKGSEFGDDADFSPYYGEGIIALDACTAYSKKVNVITIDI